MKLSNSILSIEISNSGAELVSIKKDNQEYLWQADKAYWGRHAPILFPIVGRLWNDAYRVEGQPFVMKQHGFARDAMFEKIDEGIFILKSSNDSFKKYPYHFELCVHYQLENNKIVTKWTVLNTGDNRMYFQIGAHPGFNYPNFKADDAIHGYMAFEKNSKTIQSLQISCLENGFVAKDKHTLCFDGLLPLQDTLFKHDALVIENQQIEKVILFDKTKKPYLSVTCPQAEVIGVWSPNKPDCPFVCIEPWCGRADSIGFDGELSQRAYIHGLEPNQNFTFEYQLEIL